MSFVVTEKKKCCVVGATGMVGQRFLTLLADHPYFEVTCLAASARSAGKTYAEAVGSRWKMQGEMPAHIGDMQVLDAANVSEVAELVDFVFCAVDMKKDEILALEEACRTLHGWRLPDATLYVTLEPCPMCAGAIVNARIDRVVFGASDLRAGAFGSVVDLNARPLNHKVDIRGGVCSEDCRSVLSSYFRTKRKKGE